ncbi:MAG: GNAT family N-acetyltransferase [Microbacteriaceae bacterium]|nr:GNAT family N-acetyltransferase [Microbacteriaceae bacterium]
MGSITYEAAATPTRAELVELYDAVGWSAYTRDPDRLVAAVNASLRLITVRDDGELIGLARLVGDGHSIVYLQDILIRPTHQSRGIGREVFQRLFAPFEDVRQKVLITDDEPAQRAFYESMGFREASSLEHPIRTYVQLG